MEIPVQILIEGTPYCLNLGDVAMLQVAVQRLRGIWPRARILVLTSDPEKLQFYCPGVEPVFNSTRDLWFDSPAVLGRTPGRGRFEELVRHRWPLLYGRILCRRLSADVSARSLLDFFLRTLGTTDLFVIEGMGSFSSVFVPTVVNMMRTIPLVKAIGMRAVAFGQGIGPIDETSTLWDVASRSLPLLDFISLREGRSGPRLLEELGVSNGRVAVTGDDAIEIAYRDGPTPPPSKLLGVSLRVAKYSGVTSDDARWLGAIIGSVALALGAEIAGVPTSFGPGESDPEALSTMFPGRSWVSVGDGKVTPQAVVQEIGRLRVVITGVYHAAVFALSQGIPVVALMKSEYYGDKFLGLAAQFGPGCDVIDLSGDDVAAQIRRSVQRFWNDPTLHRDSLLNAARSQIAASRRAWAELPVRFPELNHRAAKVTKIRGHSETPGALTAISPPGWFRDVLARSRSQRRSRERTPGATDSKP